MGRCGVQSYHYHIMIITMIMTMLNCLYVYCYHRYHYHDDNVELQGSVCGSIATAATRPSALPAQTLNTGSMAQSGKELRIMIMLMLMKMSSSQVSTKGE